MKAGWISPRAALPQALREMAASNPCGD